MSAVPPGHRPAAGGVVYLVRHGRTAGNGHRYVGWQDLPLDDTGRAQAQAAGHRLAGRRLDAVHASPLQRALATAAALQAARGGASAAPLQLDDGLREIHYGRYTGLDKREHPLRLRHEHVDRPLPDGECLDDVARRVRAYLDRTLRGALARGEAVAVVAHFWSLRLLLAALRGQDLPALLRAADYKPDNGSVFALAVQVAEDGVRCGALERVDAPCAPGAA